MFLGEDELLLGFITVTKDEWGSTTSKAQSCNPENSWHQAQQPFQAFLGLVTQDVLLCIFLLKEDVTHPVPDLQNRNI